ncbi:MAG: hypothetical protein ABIN80_23905 [Dyadobacter sp.]|uniref:hypothetical protein n=1 Tax=Dyadobacter sp. TaxID=1914288 RepID=UPI003264A058
MATLRYPGGSQVDINSVGYDWKNNYISNLFGEKSFNGTKSGSRFWAMNAISLRVRHLHQIFADCAESYFGEYDNTGINTGILPCSLSTHFIESMNNSYIKRHEESLKSSELLIYGHAHYSNSIHCSYYSVFQYMLHFHKVRRSRILQDRHKLANTGSHDLIINATFDILLTIDRQKAGYFYKQIHRLKAERVIADYKEQHIDHARGTIAYEMAKRLTSILSETIEIK